MPSEKRAANRDAKADSRAGHHRSRRKIMMTVSTFRAEAVAKPSGGNLAQRVGPGERGEHQPHGALAQTKLLGDFRLRHRDVAAVHVADQVHQADQKQDPPSGSWWVWTQAIYTGMPATGEAVRWHPIGSVLRRIKPTAHAQRARCRRNWSRAPRRPPASLSRRKDRRPGRPA